MSRTCLQCKRPIRGRVDKKFCDDTCRNTYNNRESRAINNMIRQVNRRLAKNRRILAELNPFGKSKTTRYTLMARDFDFSCFTSIYETRKGGRYYFCYEQGYIFLEDNQVALVVKKDYVNQRIVARRRGRS